MAVFQRSMQYLGQARAASSLEKNMLEDVEEFLNTDRNEATIVSSSLEDAVDDIAVKTKRKKKSEVKTKSAEKLSKQERIEKYFRKRVD